jgi:hypothetical protein
MGNYQGLKDEVESRPHSMNIGFLHIGKPTLMHPSYFL